MKKLITPLLVSVFVFSMTFSWACLGGLKGDCDRLRDETCQLSAAQLRTKDQAKDGSCQLAAAQLRVKDQLKDGSCLI
ncbi:hypothetical protein [Phosphitispora fastidiosa]|uniref:hypothetical protein n=1 Tax=Phosphitispora fastidiosa TaxID=2837202 RepID=UPI001E45C653|nr:hypothetical protein [Phosphitispora fastidiosa]MBU7005915.1 hypothetical protein [Phosphitispora fastidiosa]